MSQIVNQTEALQGQIRELQQQMVNLQQQREVDEQRHQEQIQQILETMPVQNLFTRSVMAQKEAAERRIIAFERRRKIDAAVEGGTAAKITAKSALIIAVKVGVKISPQQIAKFVPGLGVLCGAYLVTCRIIRGDSWPKIAAEAASAAAGLLGFIPAVGPLVAGGISLVIDGIMIPIDIKYPTSVPSTPTDEIAIPTINDAYECLAINGLDPTQEEVDHSYRTMSQLIHPDRLVAVGGQIQLNRQTMQAILNRARNIIYAAHPDWEKKNV